MTHEEIFTVLARAELRSYRQLPQVWYQIQTKFRDEPRPKSGLLRVRQFTMKDSYSFDLHRAGLDKAFEDHRQAYVRIFERCALKTIQVEAHSGAMGGSGSTEFMVPTDAGEDLIASCESCGYAANTEKAESRAETPDKYKPAGARRRSRTSHAGGTTIEALAAKPTASPRPAAQDAGVRRRRQAGGGNRQGDDQLNEAKLQTATGASILRPPIGGDRALDGREAGSLGGVGLAGKSLRVFLDKRLVGLSGLSRGRTATASTCATSRCPATWRTRPRRICGPSRPASVPALRTSAGRREGAGSRPHLQAGRATPSRWARGCSTRAARKCR